MKNFLPEDVDEVYSPYNYESGIKPTEWSQVAFFNKNNLGIICIDGICGAINKHGEIILPFEYENLIDFNDDGCGLILAKKNNLWGYINWKNEVVIPFEYSYASIFENNEALVCKNDKYFIINVKNEILRTSEGLKKID